MNVENLKLMVEHLKTLKPEMLKMNHWRLGDKNKHECDSPGCVIGHCIILDPNPPRSKEDGMLLFQQWSEEFVDIISSEDEAWFYMFSGAWDDVDPTLEGAIKRIEYVIEHGKCPDSFDNDLLCEHDYEIDY